MFADSGQSAQTQAAANDNDDNDENDGINTILYNWMLCRDWKVLDCEDVLY